MRIFLVLILFLSVCWVQSQAHANRAEKLSLEMAGDWKLIHGNDTCYPDVRMTFEKQNPQDKKYSQVRAEFIATKDSSKDATKIFQLKKGRIKSSANDGPMQTKTTTQISWNSRELKSKVTSDSNFNGVLIRDIEEVKFEIARPIYMRITSNLFVRELAKQLDQTECLYKLAKEFFDYKLTGFKSQITTANGSSDH